MSSSLFSSQYVVPVAVSVADPCLTLCDPTGCSPQPPLSVGVPRQEYWSGLLFLSQGAFLTQGSNSSLLHWQEDALPLSHQGRSAGSSAVLKHVVVISVCAVGYRQPTFSRNVLEVKAILH